LPPHSDNQAALTSSGNALRALYRAMDAGDTGCLTASDVGLGVVEVFVMAGAVIAANSGDDDVRLLSCVSASGRVPRAALEARAERCTDPGEFTEALYELLEESIVQDLLYERFRENVFSFLGAARAIEFEPMDSVFVSNIQVAHDSRGLVAELAELRERSIPILSSKLRLVPGEGKAQPEHTRLVTACRDGATVNELVRRAGIEPNRVMQALAELLEPDVLRWASPLPALNDASPRALPASPGTIERTEVPAEDEHTDQGVVVAPVMPAEDESYLDAFGDYDTSRGDGSFSGVRDRIDLLEDVPLAEETPDSEILDMPEAEPAALVGAVSLNFSGPRLADDDARAKIEVVNEVLQTVRAAIDHLNGGGGGHARIQLIVDGSSGPFAALFGGIELQVDGRLPVEPVLKNLRKRPITEHRPLLRRASIDIIERALSLASEDLEEAQMEEVLVKVVGYQQRLGI